MACFDNELVGFSNSGSYFRFSVGKNSSRVWWVLVEDQNFPTALSGASALGRFDPGNPAHPEFPGPISFMLPFDADRTIKGFQVDDRGSSPVFYVLVEDGIANEAVLYKFDEDGNTLGTRTLYPGYEFISSVEMVGIIDDEVVVIVNSTDFTEGETDLYLVDLELAYAFISITSTSAPFGSPGYVSTVVTSDGYVWFISKLTGETPGFYSAVIYDNLGGYVDEISLGVPESASAFTIDVGVDCTYRNLVVRNPVSEEITNFSSTGVTSSSTCIQSGVFAHNGVDLLVDSGYAGDGAASVMQVLSCKAVKYLRQLQRDDRRNTPRKWGQNNNPTSRQHSLRKAPGSNTYLKDDLLVGCGC
jgi:hypothetical protein